MVNTVVETDTWAREDAVTYSSITDETCDPICTPICSETTESSTATGEENTRVYTPSVDISAENVDCKRGTQFPSPASVASAEKTHTGTLTDRVYSVETARGEQAKIGSLEDALDNMEKDTKSKTFATFKKEISDSQYKTTSANQIERKKAASEQRQRQSNNNSSNSSNSAVTGTPPPPQKRQ